MSMNADVEAAKGTVDAVDGPNGNGAPSADSPANFSTVSAPDDLPAILSRMKEAQHRDGVPTAKERIVRLDKLERALLDHQDAILSAMNEDFGTKARAEAIVSEVYLVAEGIRHAKAHLRQWMQAESRDVSISFVPGQAEVIPQPLGVVGIISPWNYPIQLAVLPLVGAIAAGNRAILKPSEVAPKTSGILGDLIRVAFAPDVVTVVLGDRHVGEAFTKLPFDHLVFTGSTRVGHMVMKAASENLVPLLLELGGKSPVILGPDADMKVAAFRVMAGKVWNAGQTCVAPDYVLLPEKSIDAFVAHARSAVAAMLPRLEGNGDYTSIINDHHFARLTGLVEEAKASGARIEPLNPAGETPSAASRKFVPTLVIGGAPTLGIFSEEIFGPILPLVAAETLDDSIAYVNARPRPLALYYFGQKSEHIDRVLDRTRSGGVTINDTLMHAAIDDLPLGGVGASGMGSYHGREGFETFTKRRPVFYQSKLTMRRMMAPPFGKLLDTFMRVMIGR